VFKNKMVDLKVSNNKLFERAIRIISDFGQVDIATARKCLLKALYNVDTGTDNEEETLQQLEQKSVASHIEQAFRSNKVVPRALLLSTGLFNNATAAQALQKEPIVKKVVQQALAERS
jgi:N-acetylmuramic acid 6-phosphate (MurNAc-6-P) etherase